MQLLGDPSDFQRIPIKDLFDFSGAEDWLGSFFHAPIRGLDAEIELYELLDWMPRTPTTLNFRRQTRF